MKFILLLLFLGYGLGASAQESSAYWNPVAAARSLPPLSPLAPERSDIIFSTRVFRPESASVAKQFGANRIEWIYLKSAEEVRVLRDVAGKIGGTLNANPVLGTDDGYARNFDDEIFVAPWMKKWGARWVTTAHQDTRKALDAKLDQLLLYGVNSIQFDDPLLQLLSARSYGGDFNLATQKGFAEWLNHEKNKPYAIEYGLLDVAQDRVYYRDFLKANYAIENNKEYMAMAQKIPSTKLWLNYIESTVDDYFKGIREKIKQTSRGRVALSMNLPDEVWPTKKNPSFFLLKYVDYLVSEVDAKDYMDVVASAKTARSLGIGFVPSIKPDNYDSNRLALMLAYSFGGNPLVPWDLYVEHGGRYYGDYFEYGDIFGFVKKNGDIFNGYEETPFVGILINLDEVDDERLKKITEILLKNNIQFYYINTTSSSNLGAKNYALDRAEIVLDITGKSDILLISKKENNGLKKFKYADEKFITEMSKIKTFDVRNNEIVVSRVETNGANKFSFHLIDRKFDKDCSRVFGIKKNLFPSGLNIKAKWHSLSNFSGIANFREEGDFYYFDRPDCSGWSILSVEY